MDDYETKNAYKEAAEKYGPPIVHWKNPFNFEIYEEEAFDEKKSWYKPTSNFHFDHPFIISNSLHCETPIRNVMKNIIPFIFRCCAKYIQIHCQDLLFKEFKVLFEEGNVEKLNLSVNNIINSNGEKINLEDILELTPKLKYFEITSPKIEAETFNKLAKMKFENKFKSFILRSFINCDAYEMFEFLKKHFDKNSKFLIYFEKNTDVNI
uniref:DUF38 domain-containing protein n=1 Tax=Panagrolaimus superbus TaxID=310955 RepID=A0A914Z4J2_9BILA